MFRKSFLTFLLALTLLLSACAVPGIAGAPATTTAPGPIVLVDGLGRSVTLAAPARQIVSIAPSGTEILFAIGAGAQVIGRDHNSDYPEAAKEIADIGGSDVYDKLNTELILSLKPDLVLAGHITPPEQIKTLEVLGATVFMLPNPTDLDGMYANLRTTAQLTGHETETEALITSLQTRVETVETKLAVVQEKPLVFYEVDGSDIKAPWTSGPGSFIDTLIGMAGGRNLGAMLKDEWAQISLEELVKQDPDLILLGDSVWGGVTPELVQQRAGWEAMNAVKNNKIFPIDDSIMSRPGPRLVDALETLARILHPELFQ